MVDNLFWDYFRENEVIYKDDILRLILQRLNLYSNISQYPGSKFRNVINADINGKGVSE